ncbi:hypothetical protein NKH77_32280 [Streptomyces sp. M19]
MNPYNTPQPAPPASRPWWKTTPAALALMAAVAVLAAISFTLGVLVMIVVVVLLWVLPPWKWVRKLGATVGTLVLLSISGGLTGQLDEAEKDKPESAAVTSEKPVATKAADPKPKVADFTGKPLDEAEEAARRRVHHRGTRRLGGGRSVVVRSAWVVCFQEPRQDDGRELIDFGAVKDGEPCPEEDGGPIAWPTMPDLHAVTWESAVRTLASRDLRGDDIRPDTAYANDILPAEGAYDDWKVCVTDPAAGEDIRTDRTPAVTLELSAPDNGCPGGEDAVLPDKDHDGTPDYRDSHDDRDTTGSGGSDGGGGDGAVTGRRQHGASRQLLLSGRRDRHPQRPPVYVQRSGAAPVAAMSTGILPRYRRHLGRCRCTAGQPAFPSFLISAPPAHELQLNHALRGFRTADVQSNIAGHQASPGPVTGVGRAAAYWFGHNQAQTPGSYAGVRSPYASWRFSMPFHFSGRRAFGAVAAVTAAVGAGWPGRCCGRGRRGRGGGFGDGGVQFHRSRDRLHGRRRAGQRHDRHRHEVPGP